MKQVDYIIVGCGLAGIAFMEQLKTHGHSFIVFDDYSQQSSTVAGGMYNPVILKRFSKVWKAAEQLALAKKCYAAIEEELQIQIDDKRPVWRVFNTHKEQNDWFAACDKPYVGEFLNEKLIKDQIACIAAPYGFGEVLHTGWVDTQALINRYRDYLMQDQKLIRERFDYPKLDLKNDGVEYHNMKAKYLVFSEGFGLKQNPYFSHLPLTGTKGELITIEAPELKLEVIVKSGVFIIPIGGARFKVGATYHREDKTHETTEEALQELEQKLNKILKCEYRVIDQKAGIRPTVKDRRPLVGNLDDYKQLFVLNGLGSRGVMIAPYVAKALYEYIAFGHPLDEEIDCRRFNEKY